MTPSSPSGSSSLRSPNLYESTSPQPSPSARSAFFQLFQATHPLAAGAQGALSASGSAGSSSSATASPAVLSPLLQQSPGAQERSPEFMVEDQLGFEGASTQWAQASSAMTSRSRAASGSRGAGMPSSSSASEYSQPSSGSSLSYPLASPNRGGDAFPVDVEDESDVDAPSSSSSRFARRRRPAGPLIASGSRLREAPPAFGLYAPTGASPTSSGGDTDRRSTSLQQLQRDVAERAERAQRMAAAALDSRMVRQTSSPRLPNATRRSPKSPKSSKSGSFDSSVTQDSLDAGSRQLADVPFSAADPYSPGGFPTPRMAKLDDPSGTALHSQRSSQLQSAQVRGLVDETHSRSASDASDTSGIILASKQAYASSSRDAWQDEPLSPPSHLRGNAYLPPGTVSATSTSSTTSSHTSSTSASTAPPPTSSVRVMPAHVTPSSFGGAPSPALLGFVPAQMAKMAEREARLEAAASGAPVAAPAATVATASHLQVAGAGGETKLSRALSYGRGRDPGAVPMSAMGKQGQLKPTLEQLNRLAAQQQPQQQHMQLQRPASRGRSDSDGSGAGLGYLSAEESLGSPMRSTSEEVPKAQRAESKMKISTSAPAVQTEKPAEMANVAAEQALGGHSRSASLGSNGAGTSALRERRLKAQAAKVDSTGEAASSELSQELPSIATDIPMPARRRPGKSAKRPGQDALLVGDRAAAVAVPSAAAVEAPVAPHETSNARQEVLASPEMNKAVPLAGEEEYSWPTAGEDRRRPSDASAKSGGSWESTTSRTASFEEPRSRATETATGLMLNGNASRTASRRSSLSSDAQTIQNRADTALGVARRGSEATTLDSRRGSENTLEFRPRSRSGSIDSCDDNEGEHAIIHVARRFPAQAGPSIRATPPVPESVSPLGSSDSSSRPPSPPRVRPAAGRTTSDAQVSQARRLSITQVHAAAAAGPTRTVSADNVRTINGLGMRGGRPETAPANGAPPRPARNRGPSAEGLAGRPSQLMMEHTRTFSTDSGATELSSDPMSPEGGSSNGGSVNDRYLGVRQPWAGYKHGNASAESAASSLRWNNNDAVSPGRMASHPNLSQQVQHHSAYESSSSSPAQQYRDLYQPQALGQLRHASGGSYGAGRPGTGSSDGRAVGGWAGARPGTASSAASDARTGYSRLGLEEIPADQASISASSIGWRGAAVSPAASMAPSRLGRHGVSLTLSEEDIELQEEPPVLTEQTSLFGVRRRLVSTYSNLGGKWPSAISRPLSSKRESNDGAEGKPSWSVLVGSEKEMRKREEALEAREKELTIEAISKAEMASVAIEVWSEARKGRWIVKGPAPPDNSLPDIVDPWGIPIDAKGIVRRRKLKSNIEMSSTRTTVRCKECHEARQARFGIVCHTCANTGLVDMVYVVQCIVRLAQFTPLKLPAHHLMGTRQPGVKYLDASDPAIREAVLRDRAIDGLQAAAQRVGKQHYAQHGSRLLMGKATISRRGLLTVAVTNHKGKGRRVFEVEDGADGKIAELGVKPKTPTEAPPPNMNYVPPPPPSSMMSDAGSMYERPHSPAPSSHRAPRPLTAPYARREQQYGSQSSGNLPYASVEPNYSSGRSTSPAPSRKTGGKLRGLFNASR